MVIVTVDTAKDSPDEIRRTIKYLQESLGEKPAAKAADLKSEDFLDLFTQQLPEPKPAERAQPMPEPKPEPKPDMAQKIEPRLDAATILKEAARKAPAKPRRPEEQEERVEVLDDTKDTFIEIVEYD